MCKNIEISKNQQKQKCLKDIRYPPKNRTLLH